METPGLNRSGAAGHLGAAGVDDPPVQGDELCAGERGHVVGLVVAAHVEDHSPPVVVGVEGVEDETRVDLHPPDIGLSTPRQQPDPGWMSGVPRVGDLLPVATISRLKVTGRSNSTMKVSLIAKSCIIGPSVTGMSVVRLTRPLESTTMCWTWSHSQ